MLSTLKDELKLFLETNQSTSQIYKKSVDSSKEIDEALISSNYLESHYFFNPSLEDEDPHFSVAEESLARSGKFSLDWIFVYLPTLILKEKVIKVYLRYRWIY